MGFTDITWFTAGSRFYKSQNMHKNFGRKSIGAVATSTAVGSFRAAVLIRFEHSCSNASSRASDTLRAGRTSRFGRGGSLDFDQSISSFRQAFKNAQATDLFITDSASILRNHRRFRFSLRPSVSTLRKCSYTD